jgi:hypothetical protein
MREFNDLNELQQNYINENPQAANFLDQSARTELSSNSFGNFIETYTQRRERRGGSAFSERVFSYWIMKILLDANFTPPFFVHKEIDVVLGYGQNTPVRKKIDFSFNRNNGNPVFIELKCNIDLIEKDLYKFFLMQSHNVNGEKLILIWEDEDRRQDQNQQPNQYIRLLNDAKHSSYLNEYFYFANGAVDLGHQIENFIDFL